MITRKLHIFFSRFVDIAGLTFYSSAFYKDLYFNVKSFKISYLALLLGISNLILVSFCYVFINSLLGFSGNGDIRVSLIEQIPEMRLQNGTLILKNNIGPSYIYHGSRRIVVIDIDAFPEKYVNSNIPLVINKTDVFMFDGKSEYYAILNFGRYFSGDTILDKQFFFQLLNAVKSTLILATFLIFYPIGLVIRALFISVNFAIFSLFGLLYGKIVKVKLSFKDLFRVAIFAVFPAVIVELLITGYLFLSNDFFFDFYYKIHSSLKENIIFLIAIGYFCFAVKSICPGSVGK